MSAEEALRREVLAAASGAGAPRDACLALIERLLDALEAGRVRAAEPVGEGWRVNAWVKQGILLAFRTGSNRGVSVGSTFHFRDRETLPTWDPNGCPRDVRIVPGGSTVRRGAYLGTGVVLMPPAYVNVGAFLDDRVMVDSHALVGSCAQVGRNVHLSAAAQLGGVLEPVGALPVTVEDDVFVGGGCGVYEGCRVGAGAVLAPGVVLTRSVSIYDVVQQRVLSADADGVLAVPSGAVVVPGARPARGGFAAKHGLQLQTPVIVKYRDRGTDASLVLEEALR